MKANITDIKRFAVHDGDGIRSTVFFKGCPLKCVWCHNPETLSFDKQLAFYSHKCTLCGDCAEVCEANVHVIENGLHTVDFEKCVKCGKCVENCLADALYIYGKEVETSEIVNLLLKDEAFFRNGGGITLSGGECLMQPEACFEILCEMKKQGINTAVDTCGFVSKEAIDKVIPYTDTFLYDIKAANAEVHKKCTGQSNEIILDNLFYIDSKDKDIEVRIPFVPGFNSDEIAKICEILKKLKHLKKVRILPYHSFAKSKYNALDMPCTLPEVLPEKEEIQNAERILEEAGILVLKSQ